MTSTKARRWACPVAALRWLRVGAGAEAQGAGRGLAGGCTAPHRPSVGWWARAVSCSVAGVIALFIMPYMKCVII